jgi:type I restriction enzyme S subunit
MNRGTINDVSQLVGSGVTPLRSNKAYWDIPCYPWLKTEQLGEFEIFDANEYISQTALDETSIKLWPPKTISVAMYGEGQTRGNVSIIMREMATNQACCNIIVDEKKADYRFVYYWLKNNYLQLRILASGVRKNLNSEDIKSFPIKYPDLPIQKCIADILFCIDKKIALNKRINAELEAMAKTLYDYWFVQFDFPDENGNPYRSSDGEMVWNEQLKREIPKGWMVIELSSIEDNIVTGKTPATSNEEFYNGQIPFVTIGDIRGNTFIVKTEQYISEAGANSQKNKYIPENALCVTCIATPGLIGFTTQLSQTNQQINSIVCQNAENRIYLYFALNDYFKYSFGAKIGATFANMNKDDFSSIKVVQPLRKVKIEFYEATKSIFEKTKQCSKENLELIRLRDWLLPILMNGQATVE